MEKKEEKESLVVESLSERVPERMPKKAAEDKLTPEIIKSNCYSNSEDVVPFAGLQKVTFQHTEVLRGKRLGVGQSGSTVYRGMDTKTGEFVALSEWKFMSQDGQKQSTHDKSKIEDEKLLKQVSSIEQEISSLIMTVSHPNLVQYLGVTQVQEDSTLILQVLTEYVAGGSLLKELGSRGLAIEIIQDYSQQLLKVLAYLHGESIVHKDIKLSSVFLDEEKKIRLADYRVGRRLCELYQAYGEQQFSKKVNTNEAKSLEKFTKRTDIVNLGLLMLSLRQGEIVTSVPTSISQSFPKELQDFFARCLYPDDGEQWSASQLLKHPFISPTCMLSSLAVEGVAERDEADGDNCMGESPYWRRDIVGHSNRLRKDFDVLESLGKGGFGSVRKVRNKLDGRLYAIKKILLKSEKEEGSVIQEVELVSSLNHKNVVRYYGSWIEVAEAPESETSSNETKSSTTEEKQKSAVEDNLMQFNSVNLMQFNSVKAPSILASAEDDGSWANRDISKQEENSFSSSSGEEEIPKAKQSSNSTESSDGITFTSNVIVMSNEFLASGGKESSQQLLEVLHIQMEYCGGTTLRSVIDKGLYENKERIWRLLREIVEGLVYVHSQGIIHRDLKPENIFLDFNDHVKIGDFGLAFTKPNCDTNNLSGVETTPTHELMTGGVGTPLYRSPELDTNSRTRYTQKVDLYSLGIISFEMCYRPMKTAMERARVLDNLRNKEIVFPEDFDSKRLDKLTQIIRWLLCHNPDKRPTSQELLKSKHIPPKITGNALEELLNHTLANTNSAGYCTVISCVMNQEITQNLDSYCNYMSSSYFANESCRQLVHNKLVEKLLQYGFQPVSTPLLVPKDKVNEQTSQMVMDHSGAILSLPNDLRTPFARQLAMGNLKSLKRFNISRVYERRPKLDKHLHEQYQCVIDIVTSCPRICNLVPDAEILWTVAKIIDDFPCLVSQNYYIRVNHVDLTKSILAFSGVAEEKIPQIIALLQECGSGNDSLQEVKELLENVGLDKRTVNGICHLFHRVSAHSRRRLRCPLMNKAAKELKIICYHAEKLGLKLSVIIDPMLVCDINHMSGILFQFVAKRNRNDILAFGGRYDKLIAKFSQGRELPQGYNAVGAIINVERVASLLIESRKPDDVISSTCDVMICVHGENITISKPRDIMAALRIIGISVSISYDILPSEANDDVIVEHCRMFGTQYVVIVSKKEYLQILIFGKHEEVKRVKVKDAVEYLTEQYTRSQQIAVTTTPVFRNQVDLPATVLEN
ncbi:eIF-2-alpha kinase GCN2-like [Paramuricea clavata]|uniref:EIF-2-alpha kinase GCN2-like n=1 Tax=Paramuricea clavata TaxID=317549 RepID=A0A7D9DHJ0_PARCT|nr:eIF-2-alpha kinase GCN2-like [Paramuricea clavata]